MSSFLEIRNVVSKDIDLNKVGSETLDEQYFLTAMYFSQLVYFRWEFVEKSLITLPHYVSHEVFDVAGTEAIFVEFEESCWVSFRGTETEYSDWKIILAFFQTRYKETESHRGFKRALSRVSSKILKKIITARTKGKKIHYTGHSMGGAIATLMCLEHKPSTATVFGCPRLLSGKTYKRFFDSFPFIRIENRWDPITCIPPSLWGLTQYDHVGKLVLYPHKFALISNHFIKNYLRASLDKYYADTTGLDDIDYSLDPKELKKERRVSNDRRKGDRRL